MARFGGDEFMVLLPGQRVPLADVQEVASKLLTALRCPLMLRGARSRSRPRSASRCTRARDDTPDELIRSADAAMYLAKQQGRATTRCYDPDLGQRRR